MPRKIIALFLMATSVIMLGLSLAGIIMTWTYSEPFRAACTNRLTAIDNELARAQTSLQNARMELERTLRIVESTEQAMTTLKGDLEQAKKLFDDVNGTLDQQLIPGLQSSRQRISDATTALKDLRTLLTQLNVFSLVNIPGDKLLSDLIASAGSLDTQISRVETLVQKASTFSGDASYLLGADFTETKNNLQNFLNVVVQYDENIQTWRSQVAWIVGSLPGWINNTAIILTVFLAWFGVSQVSLLLHGLAAWRIEKSPVAVHDAQAQVDDVAI